jgi:hypothetical protein
MEVAHLEERPTRTHCQNRGVSRDHNTRDELAAAVRDAEVHRVIREDLGDLEQHVVALGQYLRADIG